MNRGKLFFGSWSKEKMKTINIMNCLAIIFCIIGLFFSIGAIFLSGSLSRLYRIAPLVVGGVSMAVFGLFFVYLSRGKEFRVYENCIMFPKTLGRKIIPFSEISEIELNTHQEKFIPEIEINLKDGTTLKYLKNNIQDWNEFYRIMVKEIGGKVKVVE